MEWNGSGIFIYSKLLARILPAERNVAKKKSLSRINQYPVGNRTSRNSKKGAIQTWPRGRAITQVVSYQLPTAATRDRAQFMWDLWWTKWHWSRFSPSTSVSLANSHSTECFTLIIYHPGLVQ
jgi:hypothetical protein